MNPEHTVLSVYKTALCLFLFHKPVKFLNVSRFSSLVQRSVMYGENTQNFTHTTRHADPDRIAVTGIWTVCERPRLGPVNALNWDINANVLSVIVERLCGHVLFFHASRFKSKTCYVALPGKNTSVHRRWRGAVIFEGNVMVSSRFFFFFSSKVSIHVSSLH